MRITLDEYDPGWPALFSREASRIRSIPGLGASRGSASCNRAAAARPVG